jgi:DNA-binding response OmpR family regulator
MLREINKMKIQFFTDVSHKLRTPLTLIEGPVSEALNEKNLPHDVRQHLEMVKRNAMRMLVLVNKMLKYSKQRGVYITEAETDDISSPVTDIPQQEGTKPNVDEGAPKLLIVEDDNDLRAFLYSILSNKYNVIVAENGKIGLEKATSEQPDFIITDVTMPEMDGLTMVQQIKQNPDICHIPIVVLSAKASLEDRLQGLKEGIDDYITKPFSATYLRQRIENIIAQRQLLQRTWLGQLGGAEDNALETTPFSGSEETTMETPHREYRLEAPEIVDTDQEMMEKLMKFLEANISEQDLKIEDMADAVNLGRTVFYGKIKSIVGMAPFDFLRHIRMQRAEDLISRSQMNISEVAYAVGFTDPKYFTKCFKKETGMTPTEYRDKKGVTTSYENENQNENDL